MSVALSAYSTFAWSAPRLTRGALVPESEEPDFMPPSDLLLGEADEFDGLLGFSAPPDLLEDSLSAFLPDSLDDSSPELESPFLDESLFCESPAFCFLPSGFLPSVFLGLVPDGVLFAFDLPLDSFPACSPDCSPGSFEELSAELSDELLSDLLPG